MSDELLPLEFGRALGLAVFAVMNKLGGETMLVDEDDDGDVAVGRLARVGPKVVIVARLGDRAKSRSHRFTAYQTDATERGEQFKLDPDRVMFVLHETGFYSPPDYNLQLVRDPREWFNETMAAIHVALEPVALRPNCGF